MFAKVSLQTDLVELLVHAFEVVWVTSSVQLYQRRSVCVHTLRPVSVDESS